MGLQGRDLLGFFWEPFELRLEICGLGLQAPDLLCFLLWDLGFRVQGQDLIWG